MKKTTRQELDVSVINDLNRIKEINDKIGQVNGIAELDENGKIPSSQLNVDTSGLVSKEELSTQLLQQATEINRLRKVNNEQNKEIAYLKLKQEANDRIEGGTTFADDMNGNSFGIKFDEKLSENVAIKDGALTLNEGSMVEHSVNDSVVASESSYTPLGNGGRKLVRLDNGTLVCVYINSISFYLYKSVDNGSGWTNLSNKTYGSIQDVCIQTDGTYIYMLIANHNMYMSYRVIDGEGNILYEENIRIAQSTSQLQTCSLTINEEGTELHACWASKNSSYQNSLNIQYCKGTVGEGGKVTWGRVEQITTSDNSNYTHSSPTIVLDSVSNPVIIYTYLASGKYYIRSYRYNGSSWSVNNVYIGNGDAQYYPSAIFVPKSVNGLENGRIWVAWHGLDATDKSYYSVKVSYSDDNGITWSTAEKVARGNIYFQSYPSITANKNNEVFVIWQGRLISSSNYVIRQIKYTNGTWGEIENIKQLDSKDLMYPSALYDNKWNTDFTKPPLVYKLNPESINFTGSWTVGSYTPTTEATAVYKLPSTDYVGLFVQKEGSVNITATINDIPMDSLLENNEYQFTKALDVEAPVTLKLSLSRENTTNGDNDKITRMLGGRS